MDPLLDRLGRLIKSNLNTYTSDDNFTSQDADMKDAWDELNDFLNDGETTTSTHSSRPGAGASAKAAPAGPPENLRKDFKNLDVEFGAPLETVRKSYKRLLREYHPDKHAGDPEKMETATEITGRLNVSFSNIETYYKSKS